MKWKLLAGYACVAVLLLGACSGNNASGTSVGTTAPASGGDVINSGDGGSEDSQPTELSEANEAYSAAETAVGTALMAVQQATAARTSAARKAATDAIEAARRALDDAVTKAEAAVAAAEGAAAVGEATRALNKANSYRTARETELDAARVSFAWYSRVLLRQTIANGDVAVPRSGTNVATITRIPRTIPTSATDETQKVNPDAFTSTSFKDIMYANGKEVFSVADDDDGGDEFKVDGYVSSRGATLSIDETIYTAVKLTDAGLVIRTGGSGQDAPYDATFTRTKSDSTDFRRKITTWANDTNGDSNVDASDGIRGQNGWDLAIAFDEPQTRYAGNGDTSWTGNGDFYWKSIVRADASQLETDGQYYDSRAFFLLGDYRDLGTYEVWLSNHLGVVDKKLEPVAGAGVVTCPDGSIGLSCPFDDENLYLKYAAYGLFIYAPDLETFRDTTNVIVTNRYNGHVGRINTIHFGYSAFGSGDGQGTTDIGKAITSGEFHGRTLAYEVVSDQVNPSPPFATKLLRGDVTLTVTIPKGSGTGSLEGTMDNFQQWNTENKYWAAYTDNFRVTLNSVAIDESGTFSGIVGATPATGLGSSGAGVYKGSFYGPRADANDLEVAGSWSIGAADLFHANKDLYGSFGAKQKPSSD